MNNITLTELISPNELQEIVRRLGSEINRDYQDKPLLVVCVLKGSFVFMADLVRRLTCPLEVDFVRLASYGSEITSSGNVAMTKDMETCVDGKELLIVEDIVETGHTTRFLLDLLQSRHPAGIRICTLLKKTVPQKVEIPVHYAGKVIEDHFVVGYGLDWDEKYRHLPGIFKINRK